MDEAKAQTQEQDLAVSPQDDSKSETSTIRYEHEPFELFQHKATTLAAAKFHRDRADIHVERMKGGAYNRVIGLKVRAIKPKSWGISWAQKYLRACFRRLRPETYEEYVVRIPRCEDGDIDRQVATLKAIGARLALPIPDVVSFDISADNVLGKPYMVQRRIPGRLFTHMMEGLNLEQMKSATKRITELVSEISSVTAAPGAIFLDNLTSSSGPVRTDKFSVPCGDTITATSQQPLAHPLEQCETWREFQKANSFCFEDTWDSFIAISKALEQRGFLKGPCVLVHGDLREYNLLAEVRSSTQVEITGVIDWDEAFFAPQFVAYCSPFWLWISEDAPSDHLDDEKNALEEPESIADRVVKQVFLENASAEYRRFAFAPEAMLARRMYYILRKGIFGDWSFREAEAIISEWDELHPEDDVAAVEYESDFDGVDSDTDSEHTGAGDEGDVDIDT
ncbi:hypothetical protein CC86DRAFT_443233 [Ophiobolus disseminans]|uniref:Aminoglycoside phosphotransferase domain-containing protein n=1 Tax=Ophiobolus disseminans TaxID=1469910 RepID=A0A6A7AE69_9PLEO|nr:hypothetical protein CC86DRAFT_443233 [Ophiobolus disseminans]